MKSMVFIHAAFILLFILSGSSWENVTFNDFQGNALPVAGYMNWKYNL